MTVKEFFSLMEGKSNDKITVELSDDVTSTCTHLSPDILTSDDDCHDNWKNAIVLSWRIYSKNEIFLRVKIQ